MRIGTVLSLHRFPVKALRGETLERAEVGPTGLVGDRSTALFVRSGGHARTGKTYRGKENPLLHTIDSPGRAETLAGDDGVTIEPEAEAEHYFDAQPVSLVFDSWLRELGALAGRDIEALRFRPNIVAAADPSFTGAEASLVGAKLTIGDVELTVVEPIVRCVTPSYDLTTGARDPALQKVIAVDRGNLMGIYCTVARPGTLVTGATIERS